VNAEPNRPQSNVHRSVPLVCLPPLPYLPQAQAANASRSARAQRRAVRRRGVVATLAEPAARGRRAWNVLRLGALNFYPHGRRWQARAPGALVGRLPAGRAGANPRRPGPSAPRASPGEARRGTGAPGESHAQCQWPLDTARPGPRAEA
jgi:hypothetical protein